MNHSSLSRSLKIRYTAPSLSATSHSSRDQDGQLFLLSRGAPPPLANASRASRSALARGAWPQALHQYPDVRHGPATCTTLPPANPRRSVVTRTGRPSLTATRAGTGSRQRRRACGTTLFNPRGAPPPRAGPLAALARPQALSSFNPRGALQPSLA